MPVICQKCGIEVDDRGPKVDFIDCCEDCEQEEKSVYDGWDDTDTERPQEWSDENRHCHPDDYDYYSDLCDDLDDFVTDFRQLIPDNAFLNWSYGIEKEWWLNGTMPDPRDKDFEREDGKPLWWSDEIDDNPLIHYGQPPAQWDPWV